MMVLLLLDLLDNRIALLHNVLEDEAFVVRVGRGVAAAIVHHELLLAEDDVLLNESLLGLLQQVCGSQLDVGGLGLQVRWVDNLDCSQVLNRNGHQNGTTVLLLLLLNTNDFTHPVGSATRRQHDVLIVQEDGSTGLARRHRTVLQLKGNFFIQIVRNRLASLGRCNAVYFDLLAVD
uniref:(northern house mosquito) hypothetical protein n=1 Tax=Culex pipiens TaxID=7175 RepID=A0A8D8IFT4_CULPI